MDKRFVTLLVVVTLLICQFYWSIEAKQFHFKYYSFRRKQRNARKYKVREEDCEAHTCSTTGIYGLEKTKCTRKCVSQQCYKELYAWDELEEGEIDVRLNSFKGCYMKELQEMEMKGLL